MSSSSPSSSSSSGPSSGTDHVPAIRTFQLDSTAMGELQSSVNLFRGDVNLTQTLFTLPGREDDPQLDVSLALQYQSNVLSQATTWNREAPTGVAGLGFSLSRTRIELSDNGSPTPGAWSWTLFQDGVPSLLVAEGETPALFTLPAAAASQILGQMQAGKVVPASLVSLCASHAVALSASSVVTTHQEDGWHIDDPLQQKEFLLAGSSSACVLRDGGQSFQLASYQFWKILYYPTWERWEITRDSGHRMSLGGLTGTTMASGSLASHGNSIEWGVRWGSENDSTGCWQGPASQTKRQQQYARAWNLHSLANLWGDRVLYSYNEFAADATGLVPGVEQRVGSDSGKIYTKACYLTGITDIFGRKVVLSYGDKIFDAGTAESPREYADPHKAIPDNRPNGYQDCYETRYLSRIVIHSPTGVVLYTYDLSYAPRPDAGTAAAVANVTSFTGSLKGDTFKRFLTAITLTNRNGLVMPGLKFSWYLDKAGGTVPEGSSPGALKSILYPQGGSATYLYTATSLPLCDRDHVVTPPLRQPGNIPCGGTPRCWFGSDYAVTTWYDAGKGQLALQVFTWAGRWIPWQPDPQTPLVYDVSTGIDLRSLNVVASQEFFALSFVHNKDNDTTGALQTDVFLYRRDPARSGQWVAASLDGVTTGCNTPSLRYEGNKVRLLAGNTFLLATSMTSPWQYDRITWRWSNRRWSRENFSLSGYTWVAANSDSYALLDRATSTVRVYALTPALRWREGGSQVISSVASRREDDVTMVAGSGMVAINQKTVSSIQRTDWKLSLVRWNQNYAMQSLYESTGTDIHESGGRYVVSWVPVVIGNDMVAVNGHLFRFTGTEWLANSSLVPQRTATGSEQRFAWGPDYAIQVTVDSRAAATARVAAFDADTNVTSWSQEAVTPVPPLTPSSQFLVPAVANWPSAGRQDYLAIGQYLYFRGTDSNWQKAVVANTPANLQTLLDQASGGTSVYELYSQALVNQSPQFLASSGISRKDLQSSQAVAFQLRNGQVRSTQTLNHQRMPTERDSGGLMSGMYPGGPSTFLTYPDSVGSLSAASSFTLHRSLDGATSGSLVHYAVTTLLLDDGYGTPWATSYRPDPASATSDPAGQVVKYYQNTVWPGTSDPSRSAPAGKVVNRYLNGLEDTSGNNACNMLDGMLKTVETWDSAGVLVSSVNNSWTTWTDRSLAATGSATACLYGAWVGQTQVDRLQDGVPSVEKTTFVADGQTAPFCGQPLETITSAVDAGKDAGSGDTQVFVTRSLYGCEVDEVFRTLNMLDSKVQEISTARTGNTGTGNTGTGITRSATASPWRLWPSDGGATVPATEAELAWTGGVAAAFPFASYSSGSVPAGWRLNQQILARAGNGLTSESIDGCNLITSTLYGSAAGSTTWPVAEIINASLLQGQAAFWAMEPYENGGGFVSHGGQMDSNDVHCGTRSLRLPALAGGTPASVSVSLTPDATRSPVYLLGYWLKTPASWQVSASSGWTVTVTVNGISHTFSQPFAATGGQWAYYTLGLPLLAGNDSTGAPVTLIASARNNSTGDILLDSLLLMPLNGSLHGKTYNSETTALTSVMDASGSTTVTRYDAFQQVVASLGSNGQVRELNQAFQSRQGSASGLFDPASPNADLVLHPADGGQMESFRDGDGWQQRWLAGGDGGSRWETVSECLRFTGRNGTLTWKGWPDGQAPLTAALFFEAGGASTLDGEFAVTFGNGLRASYGRAAGFRLRDSKGAVIQAPLATPPASAAGAPWEQQWLLVLANHYLLLLVNGQVIFSVAQSADGVDPARPVTLHSDNGGLLLHNLAMMQAPRLGLTLLDGGGRQRQIQQLACTPDGAGSVRSDAILCAVLYDSLNREVATTKAAPASFGKDAALPLMLYHPSLVDVQAFMRSLDDSRIMTGDLADYYRGQSLGDVRRSDDQGYPYYGTLYEASSLERKAELGQPGKPLSVHDLKTTTRQQRKTVQYTWGASGTPAGQETLPAGSCVRNEIISPVKNRAVRLTDTIERQVYAAVHGETESEALSQSRNQYSYRDSSLTASGTLLTMQLPNALAADSQPGQENYVNLILQNSTGQTASLGTPSTGTILYLYDSCDRQRFILPPSMAADGSGFLYFRYDALGRLCEQGTVLQPWDATTLSALVNDNRWPTAQVPHQVSQATAWDGDGNDPAQIGQKVLVQTWNHAGPDGKADGENGGETGVRESFRHDPLGRIIAVTLEAGETSGTITYDYNSMNEVVAVGYPQGAPVEKIFYRYDDQSRILSIGRSRQNPDDIASYLYTCDGQVLLEKRHSGHLESARQYTSAGWPEKIIDSKASGNSSETLLSIDNSWNPDSSLASRVIKAALASRQADTALLQPDSSVSCRYDGQRRLRELLATSGVIAGETIPSCDANGNILAATSGDTVDSFRLESGNDRVASATLGGTETSLSWSDDGWMTSGAGLEIRYDRCLGLVSSVKTDAAAAPDGTGNTGTFCYGSQFQRVIKEVAFDDGRHRRQVIFSGSGAAPLATLDETGEWTLTVVGPEGLVAMLRQDETLYPLRDSQGTVWALVNGDGKAVASWAYQAFGQPVAGSSLAGACYMGQKMDEESGLYHFQSRMYHPRLRRFLSPDQARQYPSPYVFVGNDPLSMTDPSGNISQWQQIAAISISVAIIAAGLALTIATAGAAAPATGAATAAWLSLETAGTIAGQIGGAALFGAGMQGLTYSLQDRHEFTIGGMMQAMAIGAASGAVTGAATGFLSTSAYLAASQGFSIATRIGITAGTSAVAGGLSSGVSTILTNASKNEPWSSGLLGDMASGMLSSAATGAGTGVKNELVNPKVCPRIASCVDKVTEVAKNKYVIAAGAVTVTAIVGGAIGGTAWHEQKG